MVFKHIQNIGTASNVLGMKAAKQTLTLVSNVLDMFWIVDSAKCFGYEGSKANVDTSVKSLHLLAGHKVSILYKKNHGFINKLAICSCRA